MSKTASTLKGNKPLPPPPPRGPNLSLRTWLAGQALAGLAANPGPAVGSPHRIATEAVRLADAVILALGEEG